MSRKSERNVLLEVASLCMTLSKKYVEPYSHRNSPKKFTQSQLLTLLVLRAYLKTTYRGIIEVLEVSDALRQKLGLTQVPNYSTLKKFADRSSVLEIIDALLLELVRQFAAQDTEAAVDSTGFETTSASAHFQSKTGRKRSKFVKVLVCVMASTLIPSSVVLGWGPSNDKQDAPDLLAKASNVNQPQVLYADAGYDADWVHQFCRETWNVESIIKPAVHRSDGGLNGVYRPEMTEENLKAKGYGRRWLVESFMSGLKRTTGGALTARSQQALFVEAALRVLAYAFRS
jgi:hypothetical protein